MMTVTGTATLMVMLVRAMAELMGTTMTSWLRVKFNVDGNGTVTADNVG
jgi:hypothetical protein